MIPEHGEPTHTLKIFVPLNLDANPAAESWDIQEAFREAITAILPIISLGTLGLRCGDVVVSVAKDLGARTTEGDSRWVEERTVGE